MNERYSTLSTVVSHGGFSFSHIPGGDILLVPAVGFVGNRHPLHFPCMQGTPPSARSGFEITKKGYHSGQRPSS